MNDQIPHGTMPDAGCRMPEPKSDTPETDAMPKVYRYRSLVSGLIYNNPAAAGDCVALVYVPEEEAKRLERQRDSKLRLASKITQEALAITHERDEARLEVRRLKASEELLIQAGGVLAERLEFERARVAELEKDKALLDSGMIALGNTDHFQVDLRSAIRRLIEKENGAARQHRPTTTGGPE